MLRLYFENTLGSLYEHADGYALLRYHANQRTLADVRGILQHTGRLLQLRGWHTLLSDQRLLRPFTPEEQALIVDYWTTRSRGQGIVVGAVLVAENVFARLSFEQIRQQAQGALNYQLFEQETQARAWLLQQALLERPGSTAAPLR